MSAPFPGMGPYLAGDVWQEFHETLARAMRAQLMPQLAPSTWPCWRNATSPGLRPGHPLRLHPLPS
jgi:hypothetical protein